MSEQITKEDVVKTFSTDSGKKVLKFMKKIVMYDEAQFVPDVNKAAYVTGRRSVVCDLIKLMEEE